MTNQPTDPMTDKHTPDLLYVSRFATPDYAPEFGLYRGDEQSPLAIVRGDNAKANALVFAASFVMLDALNGLFEHCVMVHKHWGDGNNQKEADAAEAAARAAIAAAKGDAP